MSVQFTHEVRFGVGSEGWLRGGKNERKNGWKWTKKEIVEKEEEEENVGKEVSEIMRRKVWLMEKTE